MREYKKQSNLVTCEQEKDKDIFSEHLKRLRAERAAMSREERKNAIANDVLRYNERRQRLEVSE